MKSNSSSLRAGVVIFCCALISSVRAGKIPQLRNCGLWTTCSSFNNTMSPAEMSNHTFDSANCFCDEECHLYSDCCLDKAEFPNPITEIKGIPRSLWACHKIYKNVSVYAVTKCRDSSTDVGFLCSKTISVGKVYHYMLDIPVFSPVSQIYYANIYCAFCHGEIESIESPKLDIRCTKPNITKDQILLQGKYHAGKREWFLGNDTCEIDRGEKVVHGRPCVPSVSECPGSWADVYQANLCEAYSLIVSEKNTTYKNPHCSSCYEVNKKKLSCKRFNLRTNYPLPSLTTVMNFNWDFDSCRLPQKIWDALTEECHDMPCNDQSCMISESVCYPEVNFEGAEDAESFFVSLELKNITSSSPGYQSSVPSASRIEGYLTLVCLTISILCLLLHNVIFYLLPKLQNLPAKVLKSLSWSLIISQTLFLIGMRPIIEVPFQLCKGIAVCLHFFFLSNFFWMNIMSLDIWQTFSHLTLISRTNHTLRNYSIYVWGSSFLISAISLSFDLIQYVPVQYRPYYGKFCGVCWFANRTALGLYLYLPICILLLVNIILFSITISKLHCHKTSPELVKVAHGRKECVRFWLYVKISTIMGLTWASGVVAAISYNSIFWYLYIIFNGLQGTFIFLMFDIKKNVLNMLHSKFCVKKSKDKEIHGTNCDINTQSSRLSNNISSLSSTSKT